MPVEDWWRVHEVNVLGVYLTCRAAIPGMLERGSGRIVITGSGAAYLPGGKQTAYSASKAAAVRFGETLANQLEGRIPVFPISPGLVRTELIGDRMGDDAPWTPPELRAAARARACVRASSTGRPGGTSTPSTTRRRSSSSASSRSSRDDLNAIRLRR